MSEEKRLHILLVDDDDGLRRSLARALRRRDFVIVEATDGDEAIRLLEGGSAFDAIVTDLEMKRVSGDALVAWLSTHSPTMATRVIVITGGAQSRAREAWMRAFDPKRLVVKPTSLDDLVAAIRRVLPTVDER